MNNIPYVKAENKIIAKHYHHGSPDWEAMMSELHRKGFERNLNGVKQHTRNLVIDKKLS